MHQDLLTRQRIIALSENQRQVAIIVLCAVLLTTWAFRGLVDPLYLYGWAITALSIISIRLYLYVWIKKHIDQPQSHGFIKKMIILTTVMAGAMWGVGSIILAIPTDLFYWIFLAFMVSVFAVGSASTMAASLPVFAAYLFSSMPPITVWFFLQDSSKTSLIGIMLLVIIASAWHFARAGNRMFLDNYALFSEKVALSESLELQNRDLANAKAQADAANAAKTRFLAAASHDMRQPMQAMRLYVDVLAERLHKSQNQTIIAKLQTAHGDLSGLLESCLDISQLDSGSMRPQMQVFDLGKLLHQLHDQYLPLASSVGLNFRMHLPANTMTVHSDPEFIKDILSNLISNALRHSNRKSLLLAASRCGSAVRLEVQDNGPGIEESKQQEIFQEFVQLGNKERDRSQGVGLGLSIASRMCRLLGTRIHLDSKPGRGSLFSFEVPLASGALQDEYNHESEQEFISLAEMRVFVIENDAQLRDSLRMMLEQWQCSVTCFIGMQDILPAIKAASDAPDAIISDYRLQGDTTGAEVIRAIRVLVDKQIPALLLTGDTDPASIQDIDAAGFPMLIKPVKSLKLRLFLESCCLGYSR